MRYQTLLFDVDDTLLDFQAAEDQALRRLFELEQLELTPELKAAYQKLNHHLWEEFEKGHLSREAVTENRFGQLFQQFGKKVDGPEMEGQYRRFLNQGHQLLGNSREIVADLAKKAELYTVTNGVSKTQYQRLADAGMLPYFKDIFVSEDTGYQKPMPEYFEYVFQRIPDLQKESTVIIGDSLTSDIKGGQGAGIDTIWLNSGKKELVAGITPTYQISHLEEIYPILEERLSQNA